MPRKELPINTQDLCCRYLADQSEKSLSVEFGVSRCMIRSRLLEGGVIPRDRSASMFFRMARTPPEERSRNAAAAHDAVRGSRKTFEQRCNVANARERLQLSIGRTEEILAEKLNQAGIAVTPQKAIGPYNVDIALHEYRVAVEIFGGYWHMTGHHRARHRERFNYILNQGWTPVIIWVTTHRPLEGGAINYVVTLTEKIGANPSLRGKEHVINGRGEFTAVGKVNLNYRT